MEGGLFGRVSDATAFRFALFIVLVWLAVALGIVLAGLVPNIPNGARAIMAPTLTDAGKQPDVHLG